jgi:hypothetical protein
MMRFQGDLGCATLPIQEIFNARNPGKLQARLTNFVTDAQAVLGEKLVGTNSILLYLIGLWSC